MATSFLVSGQSSEGAMSGLFTDTHGTGAGGDIVVNANSVTLQNGGSLSAATSSTVLSATGGTITVAANQVQMDTGALITAQTTNAGNAGTINILADTLTLGNGSILNTSTAPGSTGRGGDIDIQVRQASLSGFSAITSETAGQGDAGAIIIRGSDSISLVDSFVVSNAATFPLSTAQGGPIGEKKVLR